MTKSKEVIHDWLEKLRTEGRDLNEWEENFIDSVTRQFARTEKISDRQEEILERIYSEKTPT